MMQLKYIAFIIALHLVSCKDLVDINDSKTELTGDDVFSTDDGAKQAIAGLYGQLSEGFASGNIASVTYLAGLSSDELMPGADGAIDFYNNSLLPANAAVTGLWADLYKEVYNVNAMLEGLNKSKTITPALKNQLSGEAKFLRAFCYFYLINLYGDVPLHLVTDYRVNEHMPRTSKEVVYNQIVIDLVEAQNLLSTDYSFSDNKKVRANKWVATALLARVYLYRRLWSDAEIQADLIINNTTLFKLSTLDSVFLINSDEAIWQLFSSSGNTQDAATFINPANAVMRPAIVKSFDSTDHRKTKWIRDISLGGISFCYPAKYKAIAITPITEYTTIFRLAEQYLIRAEARAHLGKISSAAADIDSIRNRAGLSFTNATSSEELLRVIEEERLHEFFTEWGHRWMDLKRSESITAPGYTRADDILPVLKTGWQSTDVLYPIPFDQIKLNPTNSQNPGYQ